MQAGLIRVMALAFMGLAIAGIMRHGQRVLGARRSVGGCALLVQRRRFPLDVLPSALRPLGLVLPVTYWLEIIRRALIPAIEASALAAWTDEGVLLYSRR